MPLTPKNRKEEWLQGLVDHETTLTPKNRPEEWMKEIIDASGSGGGGGGVLVVNFEGTEDPLYVSGVKADKTVAEVEAAYEAGTPVFGTYYDSGVYYLLILSHINKNTGQYKAQFSNIMVGQSGMEWMEIDMPVSEYHISIDWKTITAN